MNTGIVRALTVAALVGTLLAVGAEAQAAPKGAPHGAQSGHHRAVMLHGMVIGVASGSFQLQAAHTMPITVTVGMSATVTLAGMPGTASDIQSGRFVDVTGRFVTAQSAVDARRVNVVVPMVRGRVTATNGADFSMTAAHGITYQVTTTSSTRFLALQAGRVHGARNGGTGGDTAAVASPANAPMSVAVGDRVAVQGFPPSAGSTAITALRVWVGGGQAASGGGNSD